MKWLGLITVGIGRVTPRLAVARFQNRVPAEGLFVNGEKLMRLLEGLDRWSYGQKTYRPVRSGMMYVLNGERTPLGPTARGRDRAC